MIGNIELNEIDEIKKRCIKADEICNEKYDKEDTKLKGWADLWDIKIKLMEDKEDMQLDILTTYARIREEKTKFKEVDGVLKEPEITSEKQLENICKEETRNEARLLGKIKNKITIINHKLRQIGLDVYEKWDK